MGVDIQTNMVIGRSESVDDLFDAGYESVYRKRCGGCQAYEYAGRKPEGVYSANEF